MANWVALNTVQLYQRVRKKFKAAGSFRAAATADFKGSKTWTSASQNLTGSIRTIRCNIEAIPGVVALKRGGKPK